MGQTKHATMRYKAIDNCLRNTGRAYYFNDILEEVNRVLLENYLDSKGIKRRQLYDDLLFMESEAGFAAPIERIQDGRSKIIRYADPKFSISKMPINATEKEQLKAALQVISRFSGGNQFEWVNELIPQLQSELGLVDLDQKVIDFDSNIDLKGLHFIEPLFNAIINQTVLSVSYKDFQAEEPYAVVFHPYYLKRYNNRWFALGKNDANDVETWNLALDRIEGITLTKQKYEPTTINWDEYFDDMIGVTRLEDAKIEKVELLFEENSGNYVKTKPLHGTQRSYPQEDGKLKVTIEVIPNIELKRMILSFGEKVEVLSPRHLREKIAQHIREMKEKY